MNGNKNIRVLKKTCLKLISLKKRKDKGLTGSLKDPILPEGKKFFLKEEEKEEKRLPYNPLTDPRNAFFKEQT